MCCDNEILHHRQLAASAKRIARHRRNPWLAHSSNMGLPVRKEILQKKLGRGLGGHFLDIGSCGECPRASGQNGAALGIVRTVGRKCCAEVTQDLIRSEEHTSELQSLMRISYAVFCLKQQQHTK